MRMGRRRRRHSVSIRGVKTNEDSPNAQHAPHRPVQDEEKEEEEAEEEVVFTRENRGESAQHATRATPEAVFIRDCHK